MGSSAFIDAEKAESLVSLCRTTVGDTLRSVTYFTPGGFEQVYLRSDLERDADLSGFVQAETEGFRTLTDYGSDELGEYGYTIRRFENGYVTRVTGDEEGVFVTTDNLTMYGAEEVAAALRQVLE